MEPGYFLHLPAPAKLDHASSLLSPVIRDVAKDFLKIVPSAPSERASHEALVSQLKEQLDALAGRLDAYFAGLAEPTTPTGLNDKQREYDAHFHVVRADGESADLLVAATIAAFRKFYQDQQQGNSLLPLELAHLFAAAQLIVELFTDRGAD